MVGRYVRHESEIHPKCLSQSKKYNIYLVGQMGLFRPDPGTILPLVRFMETPINSPLDNTFYKVTHRSPPNFCLSRKKVVPLRDKTGLPLLGLRLPRPGLPRPPQRGGLQRMGKRFVPNRCDGTPKTRTPTPPAPSKRGNSAKNTQTTKIRKANIRISKYTQSGNTH